MQFLVLGGSACGKSEYAERIVQSFPSPRFYIATMQPYGDEGRERVQKHRAMREGKGFTTIERYKDLLGLILPQRGTVLLECIGNLTANEMFSADCEKDSTDAVIGGITHLKNQCENLIIVTNETGSDGNIYDEATERYINALGRINAALVLFSDCVYEVVAGIPVCHKGDFII